MITFSKTILDRIPEITEELSYKNIIGQYRSWKQGFLHVLPICYFIIFCVLIFLLMRRLPIFTMSTDSEFTRVIIGVAVSIVVAAIFCDIMLICMNYFKDMFIYTNSKIEKNILESHYGKTINKSYNSIKGKNQLPNITYDIIQEIRIEKLRNFFIADSIPFWENSLDFFYRHVEILSRKRDRRRITNQIAFCCLSAFLGYSFGLIKINMPPTYLLICLGGTMIYIIILCYLFETPAVKDLKKIYRKEYRALLETTDAAYLNLLRKQNK